jgi:nitrile hydratase
MNSITDMGGIDGFGPIIVEKDEPAFHQEWEKHSVAVHMALAIGGSWIDDECRFSIEKMDPVQYLATSYYEHWLHFIEDLLITKNIVTKNEIDAGRLMTSGKGSSFVRKVAPDVALQEFRAARPLTRPTDQQPRFTEGQEVKARNLNPLTHTRLPRYVRGKVGRVLKNLGSFGLPDTRAHGLGENPQHVYSVRFDGRELWGPQGGSKDAVILDMYDAYLDPVQ